MSAPSARQDASLAYDSPSGRALMFGGVNGGSGTIHSDFFEFGARWVDVTPGVKPTARYGATSDWDSVTGRILLFGGQGSGVTKYSDLWQRVSGTAWEQLIPLGIRPGKRSYASSCFAGSGTLLGTGGRYYVFGGYDGVSTLDNMWYLDVTTGAWVSVVPATLPGARAYHSMAYDPLTGKLITFGGHSGGLVVDETWVYEGGTWVNKAPITSPGTRRSYCLMWHPVRQRFILFGGIDNAAARKNDLWEWNDTTGDWVAIVPVGTTPSTRYGSAWCYDEENDHVVLFGGYDGAADDETWTLTYDPAAATWTWAQFVEATSALTYWTYYRGDRQHRIAATGFTAPAGSYVFALGSDLAGTTERLKIDDYVEVSQAAVVDMKLLRFTGRIRVPTLVDGTAWKLSILVDAVEKVSRVFSRVATIDLADVALNTSKYLTLSKTVALRLTVIAAP